MPTPESTPRRGFGQRLAGVLPDRLAGKLPDSWRTPVSGTPATPDPSTGSPPPPDASTPVPASPDPLIPAPPDAPTGTPAVPDPVPTFPDPPERQRRRSFFQRNQPTPPLYVNTGAPPADYVYVIGNENPQQQAEQVAAETIRGWYSRKKAAGPTLHTGRTAPPRNRTTTRNRNESSGIRRFYDKGVLHAMEPMYKKRLARKAEEIIRTTGDMEARPEEPAIRKTYGEKVNHDRQDEHAVNKEAKTRQVATQYQEGLHFGAQRIGDTLLPLDKTSPLFQELVTDVIEPLVINNRGVMSPAEIEEKVKELVSKHESKDPVVQHILGRDTRNRDHRMLANNLVQIAAEQRHHADEYENGTRQLVDDIDIVVADLTQGARSKVKKTFGIDTPIGFLQDKLGSIFNPATLSTVAASAILIGERGASAVVRASERTSYVFADTLGNTLPTYIAIPAAIAGGFALLRARKEANVDRALHNRQDANAAQVDLTSRSRKKMQRYVQHGYETAGTLIQDTQVSNETPEDTHRLGLRTLTENLATNPVNPEAQDAVINRVGEILARRNLSDTLGVDTLRSDTHLTIDQGDEQLTAHIKDALQELKGTLTPAEMQTRLEEAVGHWEGKLEKRINRNNRRFAVRAWADSAVKGAITAASAVTIGEITRATFSWAHELFTKQDGTTVKEALESGKPMTIDGVTMQKEPDGDIVINNGQGPLTNTDIHYENGHLVTNANLDAVPGLIPGLNERGFTVHNTFPDTPPNYDGAPGNANLNLPRGTRLVQEGGSFELWSTGDNKVKLADNIKFDQHGNVVHIDDTSNLVDVHQQAGAQEALTIVDPAKPYADFTSHVGHEWYGNLPGIYDHNELELNNARYGEHGVRWSIKGMADNGSWQHGNHPERVQINNLIKNDELFYAMWDRKLPVDAPGGKNNPFIVKPNEAHGGLSLDQQAPADHLVTVMKDGKPVSMRESDLAQLAFESNLGDFKANSNYSHKTRYFNFDVSAVTYHQDGDKWVIGHMNTSVGEGGSGIDGSAHTNPEVPKVPKKDTTIVLSGGDPTVIDIPKYEVAPPPAYKPIDIGIPFPISPRLAMDAVVPQTVSRLGNGLIPGAPDIPPVFPPGYQVSAPRRTASSRRRGSSARHEGYTGRGEHGSLGTYYTEAQKRGLSVEEAKRIFASVSTYMDKKPDAAPEIAQAIRQRMARHLMIVFRERSVDMGPVINAYLSSSDQATLQKGELGWASELTNFAHAYMAYKEVNEAKNQPAAA